MNFFKLTGNACRGRLIAPTADLSAPLAGLFGQIPSLRPYSVIQKSERKERQRGNYFQYAQMGAGDEEWAGR